MDRTMLLKALRTRQLEATKDLLMPTKPQKSIESEERPVEVHLQRLPDEKSSTTKAPYIVNAAVTSSFGRAPGQEEDDRCTVRSVFCIYNSDGEEGGLMLLNLMDRIRISLQKDPILDGMYECDLEKRIEDLQYPDDTAPFYMGEMITEWKLPPVERECAQWL